MSYHSTTSTHHYHHPPPPPPPPPRHTNTHITDGARSSDPVNRHCADPRRGFNSQPRDKQRPRARRCAAGRVDVGEYFGALTQARFLGPWGKFPEIQTQRFLVRGFPAHALAVSTTRPCAHAAAPRGRVDVAASSERRGLLLLLLLLLLLTITIVITTTTTNNNNKNDHDNDNDNDDNNDRRDAARREPRRRGAQRRGAEAGVEGHFRLQGITATWQCLYGDLTIISPTIISEQPLNFKHNSCQRGEIQVWF